ncbi:hypothetical protein ACFE04_024880 [Oxalis oulophora]
MIGASLLRKRYCCSCPLSSSLTLTLLFQRHHQFSAISNQHSFAVSYLEKCGLSPKSALSAAKYARFSTPERSPDSVLSFFTDQGFSISQLSKILTGAPSLISCKDARKLYMPKIQFFKSKGFIQTELIKTITLNPIILQRSLHGFIIPHFDYLKGLLGSDDKVVHVIKRCPALFTKNSQSRLEPNFSILQKHGVSQSGIMYMLSQQPRCLDRRPDKFEILVEEIMKFGINPLRQTFVVAMIVKSSMSKLTWQRKLDVYKKWGLSEEEMSLAFVKLPWCMAVSEEKLSKAMDIYVNKLRLESSVISKCPTMIGYSLKERIIPRSLVIQVLLLKGLIDKSIVKGSAFICSEKLFLEKFVNNYGNEVPDLLKLYDQHFK